MSRADCVRRKYHNDDTCDCVETLEAVKMAVKGKPARLFLGSIRLDRLAITGRVALWTDDSEGWWNAAVFPGASLHYAARQPDEEGYTDSLVDVFTGEDGLIWRGERHEGRDCDGYHVAGFTGYWNGKEWIESDECPNRMDGLEIV